MKYGIYPITKAFLVGNDYKDAEILFECEELDLGDVIEHNGKRYVVAFTTNFGFFWNQRNKRRRQGRQRGLFRFNDGMPFLRL